MHDLEPPRQRRFAGPKVAMDQQGGCSTLLHILTLSWQPTHTSPLTVTLGHGRRFCDVCGTIPKTTALKAVIAKGPSRAMARSRCATARCAGCTSRDSGVRGSAWLGHRPSIGRARFSSRKGSPDGRGVNLNSGNASMTNRSAALGSVTPLRQHMVEDMVDVSSTFRLAKI